MTIPLPIARVLPLLQVPHLDREFDYIVPDELDDAAQPGVRVRVRFSGRLVDGFVVERIAASDHPGKLGKLERVVSAEQVLTPEVSALVDAVAARYAGTRADVLRLAIPPRHARVEAENAPEDEPVPEFELDPAGWATYVHGEAFVEALHAGRNPRAAWQAVPGEDWPTRLAELAATVAARGESVVLVVPDQRDLDRLNAACTALLGDGHVVALAAGLGPAQRYRRWLKGLRGSAQVVVGTRAAVFAPVRSLGLIGIWDDGDDSFADPRSPYPHAREVALLRAHETGCGFVAGGFARTAEVQSLADTGWAHDLVAPRPTVRDRCAHIVVPGDTDIALERDPSAQKARLPAIAFAAARRSLDGGAPVLVQVPRRGYVPSLACAKCRTRASCRKCHGPLALSSGGAEAAAPECRWCGTADPNYRCGACGSRSLRALVVGAGRTAEELGRAFPGVPVHKSGGSDVLATVPDGAGLVVATVGAEPTVAGGYGAALLLDGWALLGRADLRAEEEALRRWMNAAAMVRSARAGGQVVVVAEPGIATVQALVRWDPIGHASGQLAERAEVGFPPAVRIAALDGGIDAIESLLTGAELPTEAEQLGPVPLPDGARPPAAGDGEPVDVVRMLVRVPRSAGAGLARALTAAQAVRSAKKISAPVRVQMDPIGL
ncbi:primosomal protein N' [Antrihabitans sp. YC2-6]|uniref:primosomal protein N' n=1 Tax=Antrihabitans sp. YC2-6 TaxID=2799498 RepID=UPI0018F70458|nr:primosomal protein N' [Antrihabitans sp. YC2-6]MBJ8345312.1 primosomal protein N' [Antrihabitans sp. YC2-6]